MHLYLVALSVAALPLLDLSNSFDGLDGLDGLNEVLEQNISSLNLDQDPTEAWGCALNIPLRRNFVAPKEANLAQHNRLKSFVAIKYGIAPPFKHTVDLTTIANQSQAPEPETLNLSLKEGEQGLVARIGYFTGVITVGSQEFSIDFDTGSSDLWIPSTNCTAFCDGKHLYNTSAEGKGHFALTYGDGSATAGQLFSDTVQIGEVVVQDQVLGAALQLSSSFASRINGQEQFVADGIVGLGWPALSSFTSGRPWFFTALDQGLIDDARFTFNLKPGQESLTIGGVVEDEYVGDIVYTNVTEQAYWRINADFMVNDEPAMVDTTMIVDSGTTLVLGPLEHVRRLLDVPGITSLGRGDYSYKCDEPPRLALRIHDRSFNFSARSLNQGRLSPGDTLDGASDQCLLAISGMDMNFFIAGDAFMSNVLTVFDVAEKRVGFADLAR